jgi:pimeloyl-ACP methyl ester carboxylesterase
VVIYSAMASMVFIDRDRRSAETGVTGGWLMTRAFFSNLVRFWSVAAVCALAVVPGTSIANGNETLPEQPMLPKEVQCKSGFLDVKQFSTDVAFQHIWGQLCFREQPTSDTPVQVLIHGGAYNHTYWDMTFKPDTYSYVRAATARGYATFNFDRLGYGASDHPVAETLDFNVAGYVTHQLVQILRNGGLGVRFTRVILNGHSMGALAAENEAANYKDVDGLIVSGIGHDFNVTPNLLTIFVPAATDPKFIGNPAVASYLTTQPGGRVGVFVAPGAYELAIIPYEEGIEKDTLSPTELSSLTIDTSDATQLTQRITAPTLFAQGRYDQLWCNRTSDCETDPQSLKEASYWSPSTSFTHVIIQNAGHSINSNSMAPTFFESTFTWLKDHKLAPR